MCPVYATHHDACVVYTDGSVTNQSGWGFTVKQGATTIPEDSAAYWAVRVGLLTPLTLARHRLNPLASFSSGAYFLHSRDSGRR